MIRDGNEMVRWKLGQVLDSNLLREIMSVQCDNSFTQKIGDKLEMGYKNMVKIEAL